MRVDDVASNIWRALSSGHGSPPSSPPRRGGASSLRGSGARIPSLVRGGTNSQPRISLARGGTNSQSRTPREDAFTVLALFPSAAAAVSFAHAVHVALIYEEWELPGCEESHVAIVVAGPRMYSASAILALRAYCGLARLLRMMTPKEFTLPHRPPFLGGPIIGET